MPIRHGRMLVSPFTFYRGPPSSWRPICGTRRQLGSPPSCAATPPAELRNVRPHQHRQAPLTVMDAHRQGPRSEAGSKRTWHRPRTGDGSFQRLLGGSVRNRARTGRAEARDVRAGRRCAPRCLLHASGRSSTPRPRAPGSSAETRWSSGCSRSDSPVITLVAPPGYGKTTVLAQWAERLGPEWRGCRATRPTTTPSRSGPPSPQRSTRSRTWARRRRSCSRPAAAASGRPRLRGCDRADRRADDHRARSPRTRREQRAAMRRWPSSR